MLFLQYADCCKARAEIYTEAGVYSYILRYIMLCYSLLNIAVVNNYLDRLSSMSTSSCLTLRQLVISYSLDSWRMWYVHLQVGYISHKYPRGLSQFYGIGNVRHLCK